MAKGNRLTVKRIERALRRGMADRLGDGDGLILEVGDRGSASWLLRWERHGKEHWHGLGSYADVSLDEAREEARQKRRAIRKDGINPIETKCAERAAEQVARARTRTFGECATAYFEAHLPTWTHRAHATQWSSTMLGRTLTGEAVAVDYCKALRHVPVAALDVPLVLSVIQPVWHDKPETASRIRNRIESVVDWATAAGLRPVEAGNPAALKTLGKLLPKRSKGDKAHHAAMPYRDVPALVAKLRERRGSDVAALLFLILTTARSGEVLGAKWSEVDFDAALWTVPASRMKAGKEHRQPLSQAALDLLRSLPTEHGSDFLFIGSRAGQPLTDGALLKLLRSKLGVEAATAHGMRSCFSDWAHERSGASNIAIELSLAHSVGTQVEQSYRRTDLLKQRARLMERWGSFCTSPPVTASGTAEVVPLRA
jgi:integrase